MQTQATRTVPHMYVSGGELAYNTMTGRFYYQGRKVDRATAVRLGWR